MRELKVVGFDVDGKRIICQITDAAETFALRADERLRAALRGEQDRLGQPQIDVEVATVLTPKEIQAKIRAGASVEQVAAAAGVEISRVERFAHPVLLERARAAELASAAHPVLADGPAMLTLLETVTAALVARGLDHDTTTWDAWKSDDGRWTVQLRWKAGCSDNRAHFRFAPGAHGGTVTAIDDAARDLIDPNFDRPLRPVAAVARLDFEEPVAPQRPDPPTMPTQPTRARRGNRKPPVPGWEDVLLGVRSSGQR